MTTIDHIGADVDHAAIPTDPDAYLHQWHTTPQRLFRAFVLDIDPAERDRLSSQLTVVALPNELVPTLRPGDLLIRGHIGEGHATAASLVDGELLDTKKSAQLGRSVESGLPGRYAWVVEGGSSPHARDELLARRVTDTDGYLPATQVVLRPVGGGDVTAVAHGDTAEDYSAESFETLIEDAGDYEVDGGKYTAVEKERAAKDPSGLILTSSVVGRLEQRLAGRAPYALHVSREWTRFDGGRLGAFVADYNEFTDYFDEILTNIGRLQDLLSAGAPEIPDFMTAAQKRALRPTTDRPEDTDKKILYRQWRDEQQKYGNLVLEVADLARKSELERHRFWQTTEELRQAINEAKRLGQNKPTYEALDLSLSDALTLVDPYALAAKAGDVLVNAIEKRREYDEKMKVFASRVTDANSDVKTKFEKVRDSQDTYWASVLRHKTALRDRERTRSEARQKAALLGQKLASPGETRQAVLAEIRMPILVADAWHALATIAPWARAKMLKALAARGVVEQASLRDLSWRGQRDPFADITRMRHAWREAHYEWEPVLTDAAVDDWRRVNALWEEVFRKFNV